MAYIEDGRLHEVTAPEFKDIAKDFVSQLRRRCPDLKQTAALDLFTNLHYPDLSFASAVPMIDASGTAKPLSLQIDESEMTAAIERSKPKVQAFLSEVDRLGEVLEHWHSMVRDLFPDRTESPSFHHSFAGSLGRLLEPHAPVELKPEPVIDFTMLLAVRRGQEAAFLSAVREAIPAGSPWLEKSDRELAWALESRCKVQGDGVGPAQSLLLDSQALEGVDFYYIDQDNILGIRYTDNRYRLEPLRALSKFAVLPVEQSQIKPLPGHPAVYLAGDAVEQYEVFSRFKGKHRVVNNLFKTLDEVVPWLLEAPEEEVEEFGGPMVTPSGVMFLFQFSGKPMLYMMVCQSVNGVFIIKLADGNLMSVLFPLEHIKLGDYFLLDEALTPGGRCPVVLEVVGKTKARVRLRSIDYEMVPFGKNFMGWKQHQVLPRPGHYLSDVITKGVTATCHSNELSFHSVFKAFSPGGRPMTTYGYHRTKRRAMLSSSPSF